jgi:hypothetical protein
MAIARSLAVVGSGLPLADADVRWGWVLSNSFHVCDKAARAAAWDAESPARTEIELAQKAAAKTARNIFITCISSFLMPIYPSVQQLSCHSDARFGALGQKFRSSDNRCNYRQ